MIIWNGYGFFVAVIGFGCLLGTELLTESIYNDDDYYQSHGWPKLVAFFIAAPIVWLLGQHFNSKDAKQLIDPETNQVITLKNDHSFFFIPMEYWGPIFVVLGIIFLFVKE